MSQIEYRPSAPLDRFSMCTFASILNINELVKVTAPASKGLRARSWPQFFILFMKLFALKNLSLDFHGIAMQARASNVYFEFGPESESESCLVYNPNYLISFAESQLWEPGQICDKFP